MEFSQADMMSDIKMTLKIKYTGIKDMDYTPERVYTAKKVKQEVYGADNFAIIDDSGESYIVSGDFIRNSFRLYPN